ncbi:hypothetical protein SAMN02746041_01079 [Desulfacinum hydrothermale DSM 13146]|uniref:Uncharacterized protein n=1 Tax=Desulfacinum hydrothermale DSM 13146 TaxID=1121390 RepID=A0A1W1XB36_9BACT|nr:hypothetical protein [Desulfacinum hydrothermale]SMC20984.1 hypothetical protein SAMN02746041_01079 [Desulfacinum hydrothermale DSM 13146]
MQRHARSIPGLAPFLHGKGRGLLFLFVAGVLGGLIAARPALSSYIEADLHMPGTFPVDRHYVPLSETAGEWVFYDVVNQPRKADQGRPLICPGSPRFIPLVRIPLARPLKVVIVRESSLETRLANLLYANLELKKILLDYGRIQAKARELEALARSELAQTDLYGELAKEAGKARKASTEKEMAGSPTPDLEELERRKRHAVAAAVGGGTARSGEANGLARIARPLLALAEEEKKRGDSLAADREALAALDAPILSDQEMERLKADRARLSTGPLTRSRMEQLPWVFRWAFRALRFAISYRFEIALGLIGTLALGVLAAFFRPR